MACGNDKQCGRVITDCGNVDGLRKSYACSTEFVSYTLLKVQILLITQFFHSNAHLNTLKGIFSDKPRIIVKIYNFPFAEILNSINNMTVEGFELSYVCPTE